MPRKLPEWKNISFKRADHFGHGWSSDWNDYYVCFPDDDMFIYYWKAYPEKIVECGMFVYDNDVTKTKGKIHIDLMECEKLLSMWELFMTWKDFQIRQQ